MAKLDVSSNQLISRLNLDDHPSLIANGEYTYALNAVNITKEGSPLLRNYNGNSPCATIPYQYILIGKCSIDNEDIVVFLVNPSDIDTDGRKNSEIGILNNCTYTKVCGGYCLNFDEKYNVKAEFKKMYSGQRNVYWADGYNDRRYIDVSNPPYVNTGTECDPDYKGKILDCEKLLVRPNKLYPCISVEDVLSNGQLPSGGYQACIQYCDKNGNGLGDFTASTDVLPIYRDSVNQYVYTIEGNSPSTPTSKAIKYVFSNLDTKFPLFNLAITYTNNNQKSVRIVATLPTSTTNYVYTGSEIYKDITLDDLIAQSKSYKETKTVTQANGYLIWGDSKQRPIYNYQQYANNIQVQWVTNRVNGRNSTDGNSCYKNPITSAQSKSFMRDEVYALGIYFIYKDGSISPVYHIPGRKLNKKANGNPFLTTVDQYGHTISPSVWDSQAQQNCDINYDNYDDPDGINPRWKVYNTGLQTGFHQEYITYLANGGNPATYTGKYKVGEMSYFESEDSYPENSAVYKDLCGDKIRHHKMPDCSISPLHNNAGTYLSENIYIEQLGIEITNVEVPTDLQNEIDGYKIVIGNPTNNRTILGKGLMFNMIEYKINTLYDSEIYPYESYKLYSNYPYNNVVAPVDQTCYNTLPASDPETFPDDRYVVYNKYAIQSPEFCFNKPTLSGSELKIEGNVYGYTAPMSDSHIMNIAGIDPCYTVTPALAPIVFHSAADYNNYTKTTYLNVRRGLTASNYINSNSVADGDNEPINNIFKESTTFLKLSKNANGIASTDNITQTPVVDTTSGDTAFGLDPDKMASSYYGSYKANIPNPYGMVTDINYINNGECAETNFEKTHKTSLFVGDTYINYFTFHRRHVWYAQKYCNITSYCDLTDAAIFDNTLLSDVPKWCYGIPGFWCESHMNIDLRNSGDVLEKYWWPNLKGHNIKTWYKHIGIDGDNDYSYTQDYSALNTIYSLQALPIWYDPNDLTVDLDTRVDYSERSQFENIIDNWLIYKPLNYYDFPKKSGKLVNMETIGEDKVLYLFENASYLQPAYQTIETNVNTTYIGNGSMFSPEPRELITVDGGYAGTQSSSFLRTKFGNFWVDSKRGFVYNLSQTVDEVTKNKMFTWFQDNLPFELLKQFPTYPYADCAGYRDGLGVVITFDSSHNLVFITKKDYKAIDGKNIQLNQNNQFIIPGAHSNIIHVDDPLYFENKSWTISYNPMTQGWCSWYSFLPYFYIQTTDSYISAIPNNNTLYIHNSEDKFNYFYENPYKFIMEYSTTNTAYATTKFSSLFFKTYALKPINEQLHENTKLTFDGGYIYNSEQNTGNLEFTIQDQYNLNTILNSSTVAPNSIIIPISRQDSVWSLNNINDRINNINSVTPMFNNSWSNADYVNNFPIDKVINGSAINYNKNWFELKPLKSLYNKVRLSFSDTDHMLLTYGLVSKKRESIR